MLWSDGELEPDEAEGKMDDLLIVKRMFLRMLVLETRQAVADLPIGCRGELYVERSP